MLSVLPMCMSVYHIHVVLLEARRGHQNPWDGSYKQV